LKHGLIFCNRIYHFDFIAENYLSQKTLQNATSIIFADVRQNKFIVYYFMILNPY